MKSSIEILGSTAIFTNDDIVPVQITLKCGVDDTFQPAFVETVETRLICESKFTIGSVEKLDTRHRSESVEAELVRCEKNFAVYTTKLRFPAKRTSSQEELLGSLVLDDIEDGFRWFIQGDVVWRNGLKGEEVFDSFEKTLMFKPTAPLPFLFDLMDTEHAELVDNTPLSLVTTHAAAGLPQVPLKAGLGLRVACAVPNKFSVKRLRLMLRDTISINRVNGFQYGTCTLSTYRWLLEDVRPIVPITLSDVTNDLDPLVENIAVDHATICPSFNTKEVSHHFDLMTELTLSWLDANNVEQSCRVMSVSPVEVLPRISGSSYSMRHSKEPHCEANFEPAWITDSSDDTFDSELDSDGDSVSSVMSVHAKYDTFQLPTITSVLYE